VTFGVNNNNDDDDFLYTQLTKFRLSVDLARIFTPPPIKFLLNIALRSPHRMDARDRHNGQADVSVRPLDEQ